MDVLSKVDVNAVLAPIDAMFELALAHVKTNKTNANYEIVTAARLLRNDLGGLIERTGFTGKPRRLSMHDEASARNGEDEGDARHRYYQAHQQLASRLRMEPKWTVAASDATGTSYWLMDSADGSGPLLFFAPTMSNEEPDFFNMDHLEDAAELMDWRINSREFYELATLVLALAGESTFRLLSPGEIGEAEQSLLNQA